MRGVVVALVLSFSITAYAGRTRFGWLHDTETVPQRGVELENWFVEQDGEHYEGGTRDETLIWWGPVIGLTDRLELALPLEIQMLDEATTESTNISRFGAELRYRLGDPDPQDRGRWGGLLRAGVKRMLAEREGVHLEVGAVASADVSRFHFVADVETVIESGGGLTTYGLRPGGGVSAHLAGDFFAGAEIYAEIGFHDPESSDWIVLGPNFAWTYGRFWVSASFPIGLSKIDAAPRLNWAVAF